MSGEKETNQDWDRYRELVLSNFDRINKRLELLENTIDEVKDNHIHHVQLELESLKVQLKMYGKFGVGLIAIPGIFLAIIQIIKLVSN